MKRLALLLLIAMSCSALPGRAQNNYALQLTGSFGPNSTPRSSGVACFSIGAAKTRSYTCFHARPISVSGVSVSYQTGIERLFVKSQRLELWTGLQGGVASNQEASSGILSGSLTGLVPIRGGLAGAFTATISGAPINREQTDSSKLDFALGIGIRYTFRGEE